MINYQIEHDFHSILMGMARQFLHLLLGRCLAPGVEEKRINFKVVCYRVQASRSARPLNGINKYPVKTHRRRALEMFVPARKGSGQQWKEVIQNHLPYCILTGTDETISSRIFLEGFQTIDTHLTIPYLSRNLRSKFYDGTG